jgi:uncharacterized protein YjbI with pentapeptide repeats
MSTATIVLLVVGLMAVPTLPGIWGWWPSRRDPTCRRDLGVALMTGAVVAGAILLIQVVFDARIASIEHHRQAEQRRRDQIARAADARASLQLTVGLARNLRGMDFRGKDLSGFYLGWKNLRDALFAEAHLENAMLPGADLRGASLDGADLRSAHFDRARLERTNLNGADLRGAVLSLAHIDGADMTWADLRGANLRTAVGRASFARATYDSTTQWPSGGSDPTCPAGRWCKMPSNA